MHFRQLIFLKQHDLSLINVVKLFMNMAYSIYHKPSAISFRYYLFFVPGFFCMNYTHMWAHTQTKNT